MNVFVAQLTVEQWVEKCFGPGSLTDVVERRQRFLEEALELAQACGASKEEAIDLINYVYSRPVGELEQEVGGAFTTLLALCSGLNVSLSAAASKELSRIQHPDVMETIRAKQAGKPSFGAGGPQ